MGMQDPTNPDIRASFASDLDCWRTIVPEDDLSLFHDIAERFWEKELPRSSVEYIVRIRCQRESLSSSTAAYWADL